MDLVDVGRSAVMFFPVFRSRPGERALSGIFFHLKVKNERKLDVLAVHESTGCPRIRDILRILFSKVK